MNECSSDTVPVDLRERSRLQCRADKEEIEKRKEKEREMIE